MKLLTSIFEKVNSGSTRSVVIKKNIIGSFIIKGLSIATSLLLVPVTLKMLNPEKYGIWITLYSIVNWFNMMDLGLGNGFRNKFAEAIALGENEKARKYVETIYGSTIVIALGLFTTYSFVHPLLNWYKILNITPNFNENISVIVWIVFGLFSLQLILKNIKTILLALQKTALSNSIGFLGNLIALITILILGELNLANLKTIAMAFMFSPILVLLVSSLILFKKYIRNYQPKKLNIQKKYFNSLMNLGLKFFIIQVTTIVMFASGNFIITQLYGPESVTPYDISYRLFASTLGFFSIFIAPFWSAYTEAITLKDFNWIKTVQRKLIIVWLVFAFGIVILLLLSPLIFHYWIGESVKIPIILSIMFAFYAILLSWNGLYSQFLNGVGKIRLSLYGSIFQLVTNIPLAIFLAKILNFGLIGVILATNINLMIGGVIAPIQVYKIINQKAQGLWNK